MQLIFHPYARFLKTSDQGPVPFDEIEKFPDARATRVGMQPQQLYSRFFQRRKPGFAKIFIQQYKSLFQSIYPVIFKFL